MASTLRWLIARVRARTATRRMTNNNERFARLEHIKRFAVLDRDLTQAEGELTATLKVKRAAVYDLYDETLERRCD
jgi:long-chain acyl-CoA synthetase